MHRGGRDEALDADHALFDVAGERAAASPIPLEFLGLPGEQIPLDAESAGSGDESALSSFQAELKQLKDDSAREARSCARFSMILSQTINVPLE